MAFSDLDAASLVRALYFFDGDPQVSWDFLSLTSTTGVAWGVKAGDGRIDNIVFRGTSNIEDAFRDFDAMPVAAMAPYGALGLVHGGFFKGVPAAAAQILNRNPLGNVRLMGHSYGAAHAQLVGECLACRGVAVDVYLFGEPPSTKKPPRAARSWRNGPDPVCDPPLWPYPPRKDFLHINEPPPPGDNWGPVMGWHHIQRYQKGLARLQAPAPPIIITSAEDDRMAALTLENTRQGYENLWAKMQIRPEKKEGFARYAQIIAAGKPHYDDVEKATGVPWWFVGIIHLRESNCNFKTALHNGDPLFAANGTPLKTVHVPAGRGPFSSWADAAIDALTMQGLNQVKAWDIPTALFHFEEYNGWGYVSKGINSPYVWAGSNLYSRGKFVSDGQFSALFIDPQPGCAPMLAQLILMNLIPDLAKKVISMATTTASTPVVPAAPLAPAKNSSTGVTVNVGQNLATHIITAVGAVLAATGLSQVHGVYDAITNSSLLGGVIVSGLAMLISHFNVGGSNANTLDLIDRVLTALIPIEASKPPTLANLAAEPSPTPAAPPAAA